MNNFFVLLILAILLFSCSDNKKKEEKFLKTYKEILITRETITDTAVANKKIAEILKKYGYDEPTFRHDFMELARNSDKFRITLDSLRQSIIKDTLR